MKLLALRDAAAPLYLAAALAAYALPATAQSDKADAFVGTWLIEPPYFDPWVEAGVDLPAYPLLVIRADGRFTLYRLYSTCDAPYDAQGRAVIGTKESARLIALCGEAAERARVDGFIAGHLHMAAAGGWTLGTANRLGFVSETRGPTPEFFRDPMAHRPKMEQDARDPKLPQADRDVLRRLLELMDKQERRIASFYSTFFVFDGAPVAYKADATSLWLTGDGGEVLAYRRYRPEVLDGANAVLTLVSATALDYFRCVLAKAEAGWPETGPTNEHGSLAKKSRELAPADARLTFARILRHAGRDEEAARIMPKADENKFRAALAEIEAHPAAAAMRDRRFGAYFGCPDRDR